MESKHWIAVIVGGVGAIAAYLATAVPAWAPICNTVTGIISSMVLPYLAVSSGQAIGQKKEGVK